MILTECDESECVGFVSGFVNPPSFYKELRRRRFRLALSACAGILARPRRLKTLVADYNRAGYSATSSSESSTAELSSLAVLPSAASHGLGSRLVRRFIETAWRLGAERVVLTTDAKNNDAVNRFYQRLGFTRLRDFEPRPGRVLNEYVIDIGEGQECGTLS